MTHDMGKSFEIDSGPGREYTTPGRLLGHIYMGCSKADKTISSLEKFPSVKRLKILHMILSHHGRQEFGSPVLPAFPEAIALCRLDGLDAKVESARRLIDSDLNDASPFTEWNRHHGTWLFKG
jgi:3'-5' exoribonuclease